MTLYYYSTSDNFAKNNQDDSEFAIEKSSETYTSLTKSMDGLLYKFNDFLKSFPMNEQEILIEKSDKFYNNKYQFAKSTAKSMWYDRAVVRIAMDSDVPKELWRVVKSVMEKGGDYSDYMPSRVYQKAIKFFKTPEKQIPEKAKKKKVAFEGTCPKNEKYLNNQLARNPKVVETKRGEAGEL